MIAASRDPLFDDWLDAWMRDPSIEWASWWATIASRAKSLVEDSPECAALVRARLLRTHGPRGLKFRSLYQSDDSAQTSQAEVEKRRQIEKAIHVGSCFIDAGGVLSRAEFDWQMSWSACVLGDGFAVRVWQPIDGIPTATRWRIIHPARVCAPPEKILDPNYNGGIELDSNGRPAALWIETSAIYQGAAVSMANMQRVPWVSPDGCPNVVHMPGLRIPGSKRGLSEFAPIMLQSRMLQGVTTAYVATKRVQASHPMLLHVADVKKAREAYRGTRIENLLIAKDHEVEFPSWKFEGADYREFIDATIRSICAAWQIPWELVMGDHSAKSGASSRSLWQQHYQMAEREQSDYVNCVQRKVDESIVREINERNSLGLSDNWWHNMAGVYQGPPKVMPDPAKEIQWAEGMRALGMSKSTILNRFGEDFRDEVMQDRQDRELEAAQNPDQPEHEDTDEPGEDPEGTTADAIEDAAEGEPADSPAPSNGDPKTPSPASSAILRFGSINSEHGRDMNASQFAQLMGAITASQRQPIVNANITLPESVVATMAPPTVNVAAPVINISQQPIHVDAPNVTVTAPHITVEAADPADPAPVLVQVNPTPVTVENTVNVEQRPFVATPQRDGSVVLAPKG